jgi:hypothetical protein
MREWFGEGELLFRCYYLHSRAVQYFALRHYDVRARCVHLAYTVGSANSNREIIRRRRPWSFNRIHSVVVPPQYNSMVWWSANEVGIGELVS